jgi:hypothetical protein
MKRRGFKNPKKCDDDEEEEEEEMEKEVCLLSC